MKKFLSLILSLVLAMSLVTGSAGAVGTAAGTQRASPLDKYIGRFIRIFNAAIEDMGPYTVLCTVNARGNTCLRFGRDTDLGALVGKLNSSGLGSQAFIPKTLPAPLATEEQVRAWMGLGTPPEDPPENPPEDPVEPAAQEIAAPTAADVTASKSYETGGIISAGDFILDAAKGAVTGVSPATAAEGLEKVTVTVTAPEGKKYPGGRESVVIEVAVTVSPAASSGVDNTDATKLNAATWEGGTEWTPKPERIDLKWYKADHRAYLSDAEATKLVNDSLPTKGPFTLSYDEESRVWTGFRTVNGERRDVTVTVTRYYKVTVNGAPLTVNRIEGVPEDFEDKIDGVAAGVYIRRDSDYVLAEDVDTKGYSVTAGEGLFVDMENASIKKDLDLVDAVILEHGDFGTLYDGTKHPVMIGGVEITSGSYVRSGAVVTVAAPETAGCMTGFSAAGRDTAYFEPAGGAALGGSPETKDVTATYEVLKANESEDHAITLAPVRGVKVVIEGMSAQPEGLYNDASNNVVLTGYEANDKYYVAVKPAVTGKNAAGGSAWGKYDNDANKTTVLLGTEQKRGPVNLGKLTLGTAIMNQAVGGVLTLAPAVGIDTSAPEIDSAQTMMAYSAGRVNPVTVDTTNISHVAVGASIRLTTRPGGGWLSGGPAEGSGIFANVLKSGGTLLGVAPGGEEGSNIVAAGKAAVGFFEATEANLKDAAGKAVENVVFCVRPVSANPWGP